MAFQIKDFRSILASMVNWVRSTKVGLTDFSVGSTNRTLLEAPAAEIDQLYQEMFHGLKEAIPVATYQSFNFDKLPAVRASGLITFTAAPAPAANILIPAGTTVRSSSTGVIYETLSSATLLAGNSSIKVLASAGEAGTRGNAAANTLTELQTNIDGITSVTNEASISNGRSIETEAERKVRFQGFISSLARGVVEAIRYGASNSVLVDEDGLITERVAHVGIKEPYKTNPAGPIAKVEIYIHNGVGSTSVELVEHTQKVIDGYREEDGTAVVGWKAAGVIAEVSASGEIPQDVDCELILTSAAVAADVIASAESVINDYLLELGVGEQVIRNEIIDRVMGITGVFDMNLTTPAGNSSIAENEKIVPGTITVTEAP